MAIIFTAVHSMNFLSTWCRGTFMSTELYLKKILPNNNNPCPCMTNKITVTSKTFRTKSEHKVYIDIYADNMIT